MVKRDEAAQSLGRRRKVDRITFPLCKLLVEIKHQQPRASPLDLQKLCYVFEKQSSDILEKRLYSSIYLELSNIGHARPHGTTFSRNSFILLFFWQIN